jgi:uncharacterized protein (DUF1778 family)
MISFRATADLGHRIRRAAAARGMSTSDWLREAVLERLQRDQRLLIRKAA